MASGVYLDLSSAAVAALATMLRKATKTEKRSVWLASFQKCASVASRILGPEGVGVSSEHRLARGCSLPRIALNTRFQWSADATSACVADVACVDVLVSWSCELLTPCV